MQTINNKFEEKFFGRIKSRSLTQKQSELFSSLLPDIRFKFPIDTRKYNKIFLEIGFGMGDHTSSIALMNPDSLYIGAEPFINGVGSLLSKIHDKNISNIMIYDDDVRRLLLDFPDNFLDGVFLLFPDPWPKRRHFERRFIQPKNILAIHRILKKGGLWKIATDHADYALWTLKMFEKPEIKNIFIQFEKYNRSSRPPENIWPKTKYESMADENNDILYVSYQKI